MQMHQAYDVMALGLVVFGVLICLNIWPFFAAILVLVRVEELLETRHLLYTYVQSSSIQKLEIKLPAPRRTEILG
jgi:hypothetical protein